MPYSVPWSRKFIPSESAFSHQALVEPSKQIRLLKLAPARHRRNPIFCRLITVNFPSPESDDYTALSYCWGDPTTELPIHVNDGIVNVTRNLDTALRYLRRKRGVITLWVDALCIDQSKDEEKTQQVRFMHEIYAKASLVLVWLGESDASVKKALRFLSTPGAKLVGNGAPPLEMAHYLPKSTAWMFKGVGPPTETWISLASLFKRPWWSRVWVLQEVFFASNLTLLGCGDTWVPFASILAVLRHLSTCKPIPEASVSKNFTTIVQLLQPEGNRTEQSLGFLLQATASHRATDPRDRVFALLNMESHSGVGSFLPDYSMSTEKVYEKAMFRVLTQSSNLDILYSALGHMSLRLPSWCIDFSQASWETFDVENELTPVRRPRSTGAGGDKCSDSISYDAETSCLGLEGFIVGEIDSVTQCSTGEFKRHRISDVDCLTYPSHEGPRLSRETLRLLIDKNTFVKHAESALESRLGQAETETFLQSGDIWQIFADGKTARELSGMLDFQADDSYKPLESLMTRFSGEPFNAADDNDPISTMVLVTMLYRTFLKAYTCSYFTTNTGFIGRAINVVRKGDILCVFLGCYRPAIVRKAGDDIYTLVSFTWTQGAMDGELLQTRGREKKQMIYLV